MKILKPKNILSIIYCILLSAPFLSIAVRCGYTMINKNAYQSYYGETINEKIETQVQYNALQDNEIYLFSNPIVANTDITDIGYMFVSDVVNVNGFANNADLSQVAKIRFYKTNNYNTFQLYDANETTQIASFGMNTTSAQFTFRFKGYSTGYTGFQNANYFYSVSYNKYSYLDNVFDYSVNKFVENNNIGQIDLTSWFSNLFLSNQSVNIQYINFLNWYLNYAILVSCVNILFLVLMWFVNFARRLLEKSMNAGYDW